MKEASLGEAVVDMAIVCSSCRVDEMEGGEKSGVSGSTGKATWMDNLADKMEREETGGRRPAQKSGAGKKPHVHAGGGKSRHQNGDGGGVEEVGWRTQWEPDPTSGEEESSNYY